MRKFRDLTDYDDLASWVTREARAMKKRKVNGTKRREIYKYFLCIKKLYLH